MPLSLLHLSLVSLGLLPVCFCAITTPRCVESLGRKTVALGSVVMRSMVVPARLLEAYPLGLLSSLRSFDVGCRAELACLQLRSAGG